MKTLNFEKLGSMNLPSRIPNKRKPVLFKLNLYIFKKTGHKYYTLERGEIKDNCLVRINSKCVYADIFGSARCDCVEQLHKAIKIFAKKGGLLIYAYDQDGRGIDLRNHLKVYKLQDEGLDTVEADLKAGFKSPDRRNYEETIAILNDYKLKKIQLLTNNPHRIKDLPEAGIEIKRIPFKAVKMDRWNAAQLVVKQTKMGHLFGWDLKNKKVKDLFKKSLNQIGWK